MPIAPAKRPDRAILAAVITFVCWLWKTPGYRSQFAPEHVRTLRNMIQRHYPLPHRFACVTANPEGLDGIEIIPDRADFAEIPSPHGHGNPSCFRRLRLFAPDAAETFGERVVSIDLDTVIAGDLRPLFERSDDFVIWQDPFHAKQGCGALWMLKTGSHPEVWNGFDPDRSPQIARGAGFMGSDQGYLSHRLFAAPRWTRADGVYSFRVDCKGGLPKDARVVCFHGKTDPWSPDAPAWVAQHYF